MYVYGKNVVNEVLKNKKRVIEAYVYNNFSDETLLNKIKRTNAPINYLDKHEIDKIIDGNHQGVVLKVEDYEYVDIEELINIKKEPLLVILDHLEDPHNFGAIIRTCEAAGVDGIIIPKNRSVEVNSTVMRTSVGALENVKIAQVTNLKQTITRLKEKGFWVYGTDMEGAEYDETDYSGKTVIIIGSEGFGMTRIIREACDYIVSIPMRGKINSLNASVAAALVIYQATKGRD